VAVKALTSKDLSLAESFQQECALLESLHHPHVVQHLANIVGKDGTVSIAGDMLSQPQG
jgi:hypothetical protein